VVIFKLIALEQQPRVCSRLQRFNARGQPIHSQCTHKGKLGRHLWTSSYSFGAKGSIEFNSSSVYIQSY